MKCVVSYELEEGKMHELLSVTIKKGEYFDLGRIVLCDDEPGPMKNIGLVLSNPSPMLASVLTKPGHKLVFEVMADPTPVEIIPKPKKRPLGR